MKLTWNELDYAWTIDAETFQTRASALLGRLTTPIERALRDCGVRGKELDQILLVDGLANESTSRARTVTVDPGDGSAAVC